MKPPRSLINKLSTEHIRAFKQEMCIYAVTREWLFPQKEEVTLKKSLSELKEQCGNQEKHDQSLKDKNIFHSFEKDLPGDRKFNISEFYKTLGINTNNAITYYYKKWNDNFVQVD